MPFKSVNFMVYELYLDKKYNTIQSFSIKHPMIYLLSINSAVSASQVISAFVYNNLK